jgi:hypothetical protein
MTSFRTPVAALAIVIAVGSWVGVGRGQQVTQPAMSYGVTGEAVFPAIEGWGPDKENKNNIIWVGYYNRNAEQTLDVPVGPNNRIEPGGPDMGQPTHFEPGRHYGVFGIVVPKDYGTKKLTWTLVANGHTSVVQLWLNPPYWVNFYENPSTGNTPPVLRLVQGGPGVSGPPMGIADTKSATVNQPLTLTLWASDKPHTYDPEADLPADQRSAPRGRGDDPAAAGGRGRGRGPTNFDFGDAVGGAQPRSEFPRGGPQADVMLNWYVHKGDASKVKFGTQPIKLKHGDDVNAVMEATTTATFSAPGSYVLRAQANDETGDGGGGDLCCWSNVLVQVNVK